MFKLKSYSISMDFIVNTMNKPSLTVNSLILLLFFYIKISIFNKNSMLLIV